MCWCDRTFADFTALQLPLLFLAFYLRTQLRFGQIGFDAYNPDSIADTDLRLNILIAKIGTERIGTSQAGVLIPTQERWTDVLEKLNRRVIPQRPITIMPVRAPAEAPTGQ